MNRRIFLGTAAAAAIRAQPRRPPNILVCIADDWSYPHASAYGDPVVRTPVFDRVARQGVLFTHAFCAAPSCTPSRAAILTGQAPHRLAEGGNLWGFLPSRFPVYTDLLEQAGYFVGFTRKGWGPGDFKAGGRSRNPAGEPYRSFEEFLKAAPENRPFCFWFGSNDPHRPYEADSGVRSGMKPEDVAVPPYLPDLPEVRRDILDYYFEVQRFDREVGEILELLERTGRAANTLVVITSDNGWPFPRSKANLYDSGTRLPLAVRWPERIRPGRTLEDFVSLSDLAPTFLEAAGLKPPSEMTGRSLFGLLTGREKPGLRHEVFVERERHAHVRKGNLSYPARGVRTRDFLYIRNFRPDRWPAGDPELVHSVGPFGDCDDSPTKQLILHWRSDPPFVRYFERAFGKRPAEELYDLRNDPAQLDNVADRREYAAALADCRARLQRWMKDTADPRLTSDDDRWDGYPYFGPPARTRSATGGPSP
ncbi:MAG TPA: sulfatase [Bryobacteraceae bacterium]|nr:sulfatase [Bryobacteraceae bacterium]